MYGSVPLSDPSAWRTHYAFLAWSNAQASDAVLLRAALLDPHYDILVDALHCFGLERLQAEWRAVQDTPEGRKVAFYTDGVLLKNFAIGQGRHLSHGT